MLLKVLCFQDYQTDYYLIHHITIVSPRLKNNEIASEDQQLTKIFNDHYINIVEKSSGVKPCNIADTVATDDYRQIIKLILEKYKTHPSILAIIQNTENNFN